MERSPDDGHRSRRTAAAVPGRDDRFFDRYGYGWSDSDDAGAAAQRGLSEAVVRDISSKKNEPEWMLEQRLARGSFDKKPMPSWGGDLSGIDFDNIKYFVRPPRSRRNRGRTSSEDIKNTYDKLGIPEAEKQRLVAGVAAQYESEVVYHQIREDLEEKGVIFLDTDTDCASTRNSSRSTSAASSPPVTTSSPH
jgi:Fe-S cluster assembly protein SufB